MPANITLLLLSPYSPELNPVERVWLYPRKRFLSFRLHQNERAITDALCAAWNALRDETGRLTTLTSDPWIVCAINQVSKYASWHHLHKPPEMGIDTASQSSG